MSSLVRISIYERRELEQKARAAVTREQTGVALSLFEVWDYYRCISILQLLDLLEANEWLAQVLQFDMISHHPLGRNGTWARHDDPLHKNFLDANQEYLAIKAAALQNAGGGFYEDPDQ